MILPKNAVTEEEMEGVGAAAAIYAISESADKPEWKKVEGRDRNTKTEGKQLFEERGRERGGGGAVAE